MKIPTSSHTSMDDLVHQLDEIDMLGSRASSVTVMSDPERASLLSPFASPVNQGMDTPIIRTYPFGIRTTPLSTTGTTPGMDFLRKGSQSESDSIDSLHLQHTQLHHRGMGWDSAKKHSSFNRSGEISMSQSSQSSMSKKISPLLVSSGSATRLEFNGSGSVSCDLPVDNHAPIATPPSTNLSCEVNDACASSAAARYPNVYSNAKCSLGKDGFVTFDPASKPLLSPDHTHSSLPSHTSSSSLDSGYDQSLSLTDSCRDSCTEFIGGNSGFGGPCSLKSGPYSNKRSSSRRDSMSGYSSTVGTMSYSDLNLDSGLGDKRPMFMLKSHPLHDEYGKDGASLEDKCVLSPDGCCIEEPGPLGLTVPADCGAVRVDMSLSPNMSLSSGSLTLYRARNSEELSVNTVHSASTSILSGDTCIASDPECSLKGSRGQRLSLGKGSSSLDSETSPSSARDCEDIEAADGQCEGNVCSPDLPSPLSPDPTNNQLDLDSDVSAPIESLSLSKDPTKALPPRRLKNHFKNFHGESQSSDGSNENQQSVSQHPLPVSPANSSQVSHDPVGGDGHHSNSHLDSDATLPQLLLWSTSLSSSLPPQTPHRNTSSQVQCSNSSLSAEVSVSSLSNSPVVSPTETKPPHPSSLTGFESPYGSEADSGRGTKISLHVADASDSQEAGSADLQLSSLHQQTWNNLELKSTTDITSSLKPSSRLDPSYTHSTVRASSSPPLSNKYFRSEDEEEMCSLGGGNRRSLPPALYSSASDLSSDKHLHENDKDREEWRNTFLSLPSTTSRNSTRSKPAKEVMESNEEHEVTKSLPTQSLKKYRHNRSLLEQQLQDHNRSLLMRDRPYTLERFGNFEDVPLPDLEEFHLDTPTDYVARGHEEAESHRQQMSDFGHSLFVG